MNYDERGRKAQWVSNREAQSVSAVPVTETKHPVSAAIVTSLLVLAEYSLCDIEHSIFDLFISECVQFQQ